MANSCSIHPYVIDKDGKSVPSRLFEELRKVFSYEDAKQMYGIATDHQIRKDIGKKKWFRKNELGEISFATVMSYYLNSKKLQSSYPLLNNNDIAKNGLVYHLISEAWSQLESPSGYTYGGASIKIDRTKTYSIEEAIHLAFMFNKHHDFNDRVLATIKNEKNGKFSIELVEATSNEKRKLAKYIKNLKMLERMQANLEKLGIGLKITNNPKVELTPANADELLQGYTHILEISDETAKSSEAARLIAKLLVSGMQDTNYVQRLLSILEQRYCKKDSDTGRYYAVNNNGEEIKKKDQRIYVQGAREQVYRDLAISDDEIERIENSENPAEELAIVMIAKTIQESEWKNNSNVAKNLVERFVNYIKGLFTTALRNNLKMSYKLDVKDAESYAEDIAGVFLGSKYDKELQKKVDECNEISDKLFTHNMKIAKECYRKFSAIKKALKDKNSNLYKEVEEMAELIGRAAFIDANDYSHNGNVNHELIDTAIVTSAIESLHSMYDCISHKMEDLYDKIKKSIDEDEYGEMIYKYGDQFREVRIAMNEFSRILTTLKTFEKINYKERVTDMYAGGETSLNDMIYNCQDLINHLMGGWRELSDQMAVKFLETQLGYKYVRTTQHKIWRGYKKARIVSMEDIVSGKWHTESDKKRLYDACHDINWFDYQLGSMSNSHDLCLQACDVINKTAKSLIDKKVLKYQNSLRLLHTKINNTKIKVKDPITGNVRLMTEKDFYERSNDVDGSLTGNYLTEYNWHQYEKDKKAFMRQLHAEFNKEMEELGINLGSPEARGQKFLEWGKEKIKDWNIHHSYQDKETGITYPLTLKRLNENGTNLSREEAIDKDFTLYESQRYEMLTNSEDGEQFKELLEQIVGMKSNLDNLVDEGFIPYYRCPQFRTHFTEKMRNHKMLTGNTELGKLAWDSFVGLWVEDADVSDFGNNFFSERYDATDPLSDPSENTSELVAKIPLYGINKLRNVETDLSTDTCHSLLAYANMAINYKGIRGVSNGLEMVGQSMHGRIYRDHSTDNDRENKIDRKFNSFMQAQVYGCGMKKIKFRNIILNRIAQYSNFIASLYFLGGNFKGALVNNTVASANVIREACVGQEFGPKSFIKANNLYHMHMAKMALGGITKGDFFPNDEVGMFIRYFNTQNNSREKMMDWEPSRNFINGKLLSDLIMCPYTIGDHYSGSIGYLCKALETTLYDLNGNEYNLLEAYGKNVKQDWNEIKGELEDESKQYEEVGNKVLNRRLARQREYGMLGGSVYLKDKADIEEYKILEEIDKAIRPIFELAKKYNDEKNKGKIPDAAWNTLMNGITLNEGKPNERKIKGVYETLRDIGIDNLNKIFDKTKMSQDDIRYLLPENNEDKEKLLAKDSFDKLNNFVQGRINDIRWGFTDEARFENEARQLNVRMHGVFNNLDRGKFLNTFGGKLVGSMRGYVLGYAYMNFGAHNDKIIGGTLMKKMQLSDEDKKFMEEQYGELDDAVKVMQLKDEEGMILSFLKLFTTDKDGNVHIARNLLRFLISGFSGVMPYKEGSVHIGDWAFMDESGGYSKSQWYNLRRFEWSILFFLLGTLMRDLLYNRHKKNIEEHKEKLEYGFDDELESSVWEKILGVVYYDVARSLYENQCWSLPGKGANQEMRSVLNLVPIAVEALGDIGNVFFKEPIDTFLIHRLSDFSYLKEEDPDKFIEVRDAIKEELGDNYSKYYYTQDGYGYKEGEMKVKVHIRNKIPYLKDKRIWESEV